MPPQSQRNPTRSLEAAAKTGTRTASRIKHIRPICFIEDLHWRRTSHTKHQGSMSGHYGHGGGGGGYSGGHGGGHGGGGGGFGRQQWRSDGPSPKRYRSDGQQHGRGYDRGGRGGRGRQSGTINRPATVRVLTNFFPIDFQAKNAREVSQYQVTIVPVRHFIKKDENGTFIRDEDNKPIRTVAPGAKSRVTGFNKSISRGSTEQTRAILSKLEDELFGGAGGSGRHGEVIVNDGLSIVYSDSKLNDSYLVKIQNQFEETRFDGSPKLESFQVYLKEVATISLDNLADCVRMARGEGPFKALSGGVLDTVDLSKEAALGAMRATSFVNTIVGHAEMKNLLASGRDPKRFYREPNRREIDNSRLLQKYYGRNKHQTLAPLIGISQSVRFTQSGSLVLTADTNISHFHRSTFHESNEPIPVYNPSAGTLAGISMGRGPLGNDLKQKICDRLWAMEFNVKLTIPKGCAWERELRDRGKENEFIEGKRRQLENRYNLRMKRDHDGPTRIEERGIRFDPTSVCFIMSPPRRKDDKVKGEDRTQPEPTEVLSKAPDEETLEPEGKQVRVIDYFFERYGIRINPNLPLINTGKGWFSVEHLFQRTTEVRGDELTKDDVLSFNDEFASTNRIHHIKDTLQWILHQGNERQTLNDYLQHYSLTVNTEPLNLEAKVLDVPTLRFSNNNTVNTSRGTWNLKGVEWSASADVDSFAVLNASGNSCEDYMNNQLRSMSAHGMRVPSVNLADVTAHSRSSHFSLEKQDFAALFDEAIGRARSYFYGSIREMQVGRFLNYRTDTGEVVRAAVLRDPEQGIFLIPQSRTREDATWATHIVVNRKNSLADFAKMMFIQNGKPCDVFDLRQNQRGEYEVSGVVYELKSIPYRYVSADDIKSNPKCLFAVSEKPGFVSENELSCPDVVFVYFADRAKTEVYDFLKSLTHAKYPNTVTQCVCHAKYSSQRAKQQYCSNISLKLNTKLSSATNQARAWSTCHNATSQHGQGRMLEGIPWISEVPTLVVGYTFVRGMGRESLTVVGGSVCLDKFCVQMGHAVEIQRKEGECVTSTRMKSMCKHLLFQYKAHQHASNDGTKPLGVKRIVVFRNGGADGSFPEILSNEITEGIREAVAEDSACGADGPCRDSNCFECRPPVTCVVSQKDHSVRIVPDMGAQRGKPVNVDSGTVVDDPKIMMFENGLKLATSASEAGDNGFDFFLTAQAGLKGTSKPVLYRVLENENYTRTPPGGTSLTRDILEQMCYHMSFQYGTATKSTRLLPILKYAERAATHARNYFDHLAYTKLNTEADLLVEETLAPMLQRLWTEGRINERPDFLHGLRCHPHTTA